MQSIKLISVLSVALFAVACSGDEAEPVSVDSSGSGVNRSEASCCLNGSFYDCNGDSDKADACFSNGSPGDCERDEGNDDACRSDDSDDDDNNGDDGGGDDNFDGGGDDDFDDF